MTTKKQQRAESRYRAQLKLCRCRSWVSANRHRGELIHRSVYKKDLSRDETVLLNRLQKLADLYVTWKTNDSVGRNLRWIDSKLARLKVE